MGTVNSFRGSLMCAILLGLLAPSFAPAQQIQIIPEQRTIHARNPECLSPYPVPVIEVPFTVTDKDEARQAIRISLDEAIQIAIENAEVIRVLAGLSASSSGRTIYDVAVSNTSIDVQNSTFDPTLEFGSTMNKTDRPGAIFDPTDPSQAIIVGSSTDSINTTFGLSKRNFNGSTLGFNLSAVGSYFEPGLAPLEPENRSSAEITYRMPFMRGGGREANLAPVVIARIDTERSYFQFKDSIQELVRGVIGAYWSLVGARVDVWARQQQIEQAQFAFDLAEARMETGLAKLADVAQARSVLANFKASLITARGTLIQSETALRNILGMPPSNSTVMVPTSKPVLEKVELNWDEILSMAEQYRPDIIELKLILEADKHALIQADNQARPQFDGIANYRWDGLSGNMPSGAFLASEGGRFAGFNLGVNFSVPLGLRQGRASLRRQELVIARDRANLDQGIHQMTHQLTNNYRNLDQFFEQYIAFQEAREAAQLNFENQIGEVIAGRREFINVLQAITDWGNAVSQEARSITQYNTELANVERQSGTILETHGIRFVEERYGSLGPLGLLGILQSTECYPESLRPDGLVERYDEYSDSSDEAFNMKDLDFQRESERNKRRIEAERPEDSDSLTPPRSDNNDGSTDDDTTSSRNQWATPPQRFGQRIKNLFRK